VGDPYPLGVMIFQGAVVVSCRVPRVVVVALALIGWVLAAPAEAFAGPERRVEASTTTIELARDGSATVHHELVVASHGGPFSGFTLRGVDADAEPLADATVLRLSGAEPASLPQPGRVSISDGTLALEVGERRGLRGTSFLLRFGYRTRLLEHGVLRHLPDGQHALMSWVGPRFEDGVDSVTLIVRAPAAHAPPEVAADSSDNANYGAIVSALRRTREQDEIELVRAHVARDEAMRWEVRLDASLLPAPAGISARAPVAVAPAPSPTPQHGPQPRDIAGLIAAAIAYAALVWLKAGAVARAAADRRATPRACVAWPAALRAIAAGAALGSAVAVALWGDPPLLAAVMLLIAMAFAAHAAPEREPQALGPGEWKPLDPAALPLRRPASIPGAWFDAGRARGFVLLAVLLAGVVFAAWRAFPSSPFSGACILLAGSALLPIFCTGRAGELPIDTLAHSARFLTAVARRVARGGNLLVTPIGRVAAATGELDELRLSFTPARPVPGLIGLELGLELLPGIAGPSARPVVIVRAAEGSECQRSLPRGLTWTRGRTLDERASLVRPKLPTVTLSAALVQELCEVLLSGPEALVKKEHKSSGSGLSTVNAGTRSSPAHAT
jgi:hypothetical protein